jgi:hypothetical protein
VAEFNGQDLSGSEFERVDLSGSVFRASDLQGARFIGADLRRVVMRGVELVDVEISGEIENVTINGISIGPLVQAELDRLHPDLPKMRPTDPAGFREAWDVLEGLWAGTVDRARRLDAGMLHESVDGEWSFIQTLRHLSFATDSWLSRAILGEPSPWHPLGLPWGEIDDTTGVPHDWDARPSLEEALAVRLDRMARMRAYVDDLTEEQLGADTTPVDGPGWPPAGSTFPVRECLSILLNEEWWHRQFAERDLAVLESRTA